VDRDQEERNLIDGARCGDRAAQQELYARTSGRIHRLLLRMTGNSDDAAELAQETYLRAFACISQFDGRSALATWLYRIAVNAVLQRQRWSARRPAVSAEALPGAADPSSDSDRAATRIDVDAALESLSADDRAILLLRHHEGLDYAAIAEVIGCPTGTVASRLNRARARLRESLGPAYGGVEESGAPRHPTKGTGSAPAAAPDVETARAERTGTGSG
jgi:RNA polymerase sigma-70 factor (ECF subfamily)